jgi:hypothetical protein
MAMEHCRNAIAGFRECHDEFGLQKHEARLAEWSREWGNDPA